MTDWVDEFRETIDQATNRLLLIPNERSAIPNAEGKWSPKQIVGHLIDSAANNHQRFVRAQFGDDLVFPGTSRRRGSKCSTTMTNRGHS